MLTAFIRSIILFVAIVTALRLMGKRQIGQLQPAELVVTILLSEIAATPMQDNDIPMINTLIVTAVLVGFEIIMSALSLKSVKLRKLLQGNSVILIKNGVIDRRQMKKLRFSLDDLLEALRQKDVFDISEVAYAVAETDGSLSVMLKSAAQPPTAGELKIKKPPQSMPVAVVMDGKLTVSGLAKSELSDAEIKEALSKIKTPVSEIFLLTVDKNGNRLLIKKEDDGG